MVVKSPLDVPDIHAQIMTESVQNQVVKALREAIVAGALRPGDSLSETALAQRYGVSRTPVRESLKQLQREGLVEIIPRVGTFVSNPTPREIFELFTLKEVIEGLAAGLLAQRGDVPELAELDRALAEMEAAVATNDADRYVEANDRFHDAIIRGSDSRKLQGHFHLLINQVPYRRFVYLSLAQPHRPQDSLEEHRRVVAAIKTKDFHTAEREMRRHVGASRYQLSLGIGSKLMDQDPPLAQE